MMTANGTVTLRPKEVVPVYREEWDATVEDYKYDLVNRDFVSRNGVIYQVKKQRVNEFVPAGLDPAGENGEDYWEAFNNLAPSVANFLIIVDEDGVPATLLSGGRIQARFLNIGSLNMSETRLWGGAEPMTGKGLALINDPGDRKFAVYNDANNYVEMFMRDDEWGLKGVVGGNVEHPVFQLGSTNTIGGFEITNSRIGSFYDGSDSTAGDGMSLYDFAVKFKSNSENDDRFAALGTQVFPSSTAQPTLLRLELTRTAGDLGNILAYLSCSGATGNLGSRNIALQVENGDIFMKNGQVILNNVTSSIGNVTLTASSGHLVWLAPIVASFNPVVTISSGLPVGSWFIIGHTTTAGGSYYLKLQGTENFARRGNTYQQVHANNQDPSIIFKVGKNTWIVGNLPVNWITWS